MRAVIDTNVLLSGLLWRGPPHTLLEELRRGALVLISSPLLLAELSEVLGRSRFAAILARSNISRERTLADMRQLAEIIEPAPLPRPVCRDPDDDHVLACALTAEAEIIVTGDRDLLELGTFRAIRILTASEALSVLAELGR